MRRLVAAGLMGVVLLMAPVHARADLFGGDVAVLTQILVQAIQQVAQLRQIFSTGADTLGLLRDVNRGTRDGLFSLQVMDPRFNPGIYGSLGTADQVLRAIGDLYGQIPMTSEARLQQAQDKSVAESIAMNSVLFRFADQTDEENRRIFSRSQVVNPQGAGKLTAQSIAVLIGVSTQILRTNSMMLKMMSESVALQNRREKLQSAQFKSQYDGLSGAMGAIPKETHLKPLGTGGG